MYRYKIRRAGANQWSNRDHTLLTVMVATRRRLNRANAEEVRLQVRGGKWGRWRRRREGVRIFRDKLRRGGAGYTLRIQAGRDGTVWAVLKFEKRSPVRQTDGNSRIDQIFTWVMRNFPRAQNYGICARRPIDGTSTWTQHSPWPGPDPGSNAWDIGGPFSVLAEIARGLVAAATQYRLPVGKIIFNRRYWTPTTGWRPYTGNDPHVSHIHVEGAPERRGWPRSGCP